MFLHKIKFDIQMALHTAWDKMDQDNLGKVNLSNLNKFLIDINMPITKSDLGFLFNLIDKNSDGEIDQFEFAEFWNLNLPADFEIKKHNQKKLESDVLGKISKILNKKSVDLMELFTEADHSTRLGYLNLNSFNKFLNKIGIDIKQETQIEIMKMIQNVNDMRLNKSNKNADHRVYFTNLETILLRNGLKS